VIELTFDPNPDADQVLFAWTYRPDGEPHGVDVIVKELPDGRFQLEWGDRVANSWAENYDDPAIVFARLATLLYGVRNGGFFRHQATDDAVWTDAAGGDGPPVFVADAIEFATRQTTPYERRKTGDGTR
jgi:hypothetical protein